MSKRIIAVSVIMLLLISLAGCLGLKDSKQEKLKARADVSNAGGIAGIAIRAFVEAKLPSQEEQEINSNSGFGKILVESGSLSEIPKCYMDKTFKFFGSVSVDGRVFVKAGKDIKTAVQLFPIPEDFEEPYDILNK